MDKSAERNVKLTYVANINTGDSADTTHLQIEKQTERKNLVHLSIATTLLFHSHFLTCSLQ